MAHLHDEVLVHSASPPLDAVLQSINTCVASLKPQWVHSWRNPVDLLQQVEMVAKSSWARGM